MHPAVEKFSKYTSNIDNELQKIIQSLLSLIQSKTKTVRRLIQLHTKIQKVRDATGKFQSDYVMNEEPRIEFSLSENSINDMTTFSETASKFDEDTRKPSRHRENSSPSKKDAQIGQANSSKSNFLASEKSLQEQKSTKPPSECCVASNIKSALECLQECQRGDCVVTMDVCSYRNLVETLKTVLDSYCPEKHQNSNSSNPAKIVVGKCSTDPSLNDAYREADGRLTCSSTECRQISVKKLSR